MTRSLRRMFMTMFLVVFLGGLGVSGAHALWSQTGKVQATIMTGTWTSGPQSDWSHPLSVTADLRDSDWFGNVVVKLAWSPDKASDTNGRVRYKVNLEPADGGRVLTTMPQEVGTSRSMDVRLHMNGRLERNFTLTIIPTLDGVQGEVTTRTLTVRSWSWGARSMKTQETPSKDPQYTVEIR